MQRFSGNAAKSTITCALFQNDNLIHVYCEMNPLKKMKQCKKILLWILATSALIAAEGDLPCSVVFLKDDKSIMLDFSKNADEREFMELVLCVFIARATV